MALSYHYCTEADVRSKILGLDVSDIPSTLFQHLNDRYIPFAQREVDSFCATNFDVTTVEEFYDGTGSALLNLRHRPVREVLNVTLNIIPSAIWYQFKRWYYTAVTDSLGIRVARQGGIEPINAALTTSTIPQDISYVYDPGLGFTNQDANPANRTASFTDTVQQYGRSDLFVNTRLGTLTIPPRILFMESQGVPFWNYTWIRSVQNVRVRYIYGYSSPTQPDALIGTDKGNLPPEITDATAALTAKYLLIDKGIFMSSGTTSISAEGINKNYGEMPYAGLIKYLEESAKRTLTRYKRLGV